MPRSRSWLDSADEWESFSAAIHDRTGIDLNSYQPVQMRRRLRGLLDHAKVERLSDYVRALDREPARLRHFRSFVGIHVSEFFRSPDRFEYLGQVVLRQLLQERPRLRIWSVGCSYGAEAYSLAVLLAELAPDRRHYILATDVDDSALERAQAGDGFSAADIRHVPTALRHRHFLHGGRAVRPGLRAQVTFRRHDVLQDEPEGDFDLIVCRNVLMYFTADAKVRVARLLYDALRMGGFLFTASGEALEQLPAAGFRPASVGFYRKEGVHAGS